MQNKPAVLIENTYQLEPDPETRFKTHLVHDETKKVVIIIKEQREIAILVVFRF